MTKFRVLTTAILQAVQVGVANHALTKERPQVLIEERSPKKAEDVCVKAGEGSHSEPLLAAITLVTKLGVGEKALKTAKGHLQILDEADKNGRFQMLQDEAAKRREVEDEIFQAEKANDIKASTTSIQWTVIIGGNINVVMAAKDEAKKRRRTEVEISKTKKSKGYPYSRLKRLVAIDGCEKKPVTRQN